MKDELKREGLCELCERIYGAWYAPNEMWNRVVKDDFHFLCPTCFTMLADARGFHGVFAVGPGGPFKPQPNVWKLLMALAPGKTLKDLGAALWEQGLVVDMVETEPRETNSDPAPDLSSKATTVKGRGRPRAGGRP